MNALTTQLADALRWYSRGCTCAEELAKCRACQIDDMLAAFDAAKDAPEDDALTIAYMAGSASRLDELRAKDVKIKELLAVIGRVQHEWQVDDIDELEVAMYSAGDFREGNDAGQPTTCGKLRVRLLQQVSELREEIATLKSARPNLQPLHDLVKKWKDGDEGQHPDIYWVTYGNAVELGKAIAKLQSAGEVKP